MIELEVKELIKKNISKASAMELLKEIEDFVIVKTRKNHPLQVISFQVTNISIIGEVIEENDSSEQKKI